MRKGVTGVCGLCLVGGLLAGTPLPHASAKAGIIDKELLGIRLLQSFKTVLGLYGQPTRIYRADEVVDFIFSTDANGNQTGGIKGLGEGSQNNSGRPGGAPGGPGMPGSGGGGAPTGAPPAFAPPPPPPPPGGAPPAFAPPPPGGGGAPGGGGPLGGAQGSSDKPETFGESGGFTWVYFYPREELAYRFGFNPDGRIDSIAERGRWKGKPSQRGIRLGDPVRNVYAVYGWPDTVEQQVNTIALNYNVKRHVQISVLNGKVVSIAVFLREDQLLRLMGPNGANGGPAGAPGRPGGGGGGPRPTGKSGGGGAASAD